MLTLSQFKQLKRYKARALQYTHLDESHLLRDYRNDQRAKPEFRHIHYVGFEVCTEDQTFYYHTSILSDCMEAVNQRAKLTRKQGESASKFDHPWHVQSSGLFVWSNLECYAWKPSARSGAASWLKTRTSVRLRAG